MTRGVVYLSRIPPHLRPGKVRRLLEQHGEITNLYLAAANKTREDKKKYGRGKRFVEGWVEFAEKKSRNGSRRLSTASAWAAGRGIGTPTIFGQ